MTMKMDQFLGTDDWKKLEPTNRSLLNGYSEYRVHGDKTISLCVKDKEYDVIEEKLFFPVDSVLGDLYG